VDVSPRKFKKSTTLLAGCLTQFERQVPVASTDWDANIPEVLELLREAGNLELQDFFIFVFGNATQDLDAAPGGGARFTISIPVRETARQVRSDLGTCMICA
jgi:hypothetical protein